MRVLPMFVGLKGQFVDSVKDLLLRSGMCCVARFRHGGVVRLLSLGKRWQQSSYSWSIRLN